MNKQLLVDSQFFPCVNYVNNLVKYKHVIIEQCDTWQKQSFRNRCIISGSNGILNLTVPIEKGRNRKGQYKDIKIAGKEWAREHWKTIRSCYGGSPFFEYYAPDVEKILLSHPDFLFDLNLQILEWLQKTLKEKFQIAFTDEFMKEPDSALFVDMRNRWGPKNYILEEEEEYNKPYFQLFADRTGFQKNLSILDMLFCEGGKGVRFF